MNYDRYCAMERECWMIGVAKTMKMTTLNNISFENVANTRCCNAHIWRTGTTSIFNFVSASPRPPSR